MQAVALTQDTANRVPLTFGMGMTVHDVPSQASASVLGCGLRRMPTATHDDRDVQDTADSAAVPHRRGGLGDPRPAVPAQHAGRPVRPPRRFGMAVHAEAAEQDTCG